MRGVAVFVLAVFLAAAAFEARAQSNADIAARWGLIGTWKVDCRAPTSRSNTAITYAVRQGQLFMDRNYGDGQDSSTIQSATAKPGGLLEIVTTIPSISQTRQFAFTKGPDGRKRAMSNRDTNTGTYTVVDGKFTSNGNPTPWQTSCR